MKVTDKFDYVDKFGSVYKDCNFVVNKYYNPKNKYLAIENEEDGDITICSINLDMEFGEDEIAIKNYSENEGMVDFLKELGIIGELVKNIHSGFVIIPIYKLTESGLELFGNN